jgi:hypothetical protein
MEESQGLVVFNSSLISNLARSGGGGLYVTSTDSVDIRHSTFEGNGVSDGSGSAVWLSSSSSTLSLSSNDFHNNRAMRGSGAVYWQASPSSVREPKGLRSLNTYSNNKARNETGADFSSSSMSLVLAGVESGEILTSTSSQFLPFVEVRVVDFYGQRSMDRVLITTSTSSSANSCGDNEALNGEIAIVSVDGVGLFDGLSAVCGPEGVMNITIASELSVGSVSTSLKVTFDRCSAGEYLEGGRCLACGPGSYSLSYDDTVNCHEGCPSGAVSCQRNSIKLKRGWWRVTNSTALIFECPYGKEACLGGEAAGNNLCRGGYEGPLCAVCSTGYYFQSVDSTCRSCPKSQALNVFTIVVLIVLGLVILIAIWRTESVYLLTNFSMVSFVAFISRHVLRLKIDWESEEFQFSIERAACKTKIYVTLFQILSSFPFVLQSSFTQTYSRLMSFGSILNLNFFNDSALNCDYNYDYIDFLVIVTVGPAALTVLWLMMFLFQHSFMRWYQGKPSTDPSVVKLYGTYLEFFLVCSFLALPGVSIFIFRTFSCVDLDPDEPGGRYLQADYSISCDSDRYEWGKQYAIVMVFVYPLGVTCYYFWLLYSHRHAIQNRKSRAVLFTEEADRKSIEPLNFLYSSYAPQYWYWEVIETIRRLLLTGVLVLFVQGSAFQIVFAFVISLFFMKLYGHFGESITHSPPFLSSARSVDLLLSS